MSPEGACAGRPMVSVSFAISWDARVPAPSGVASGFLSPRGRKRLQALRTEGDALLIGRRTWEATPPEAFLPVRGKSAPPLCAVVSGSGRIDTEHPLFRFEKRPPLAIFSTSRMSAVTRATLENRANLHLATGAEIDFTAVLATLAGRYGVRRIVCEGGPTLFRSLLEAGLVDEVNLAFCPLVFGGAAVPPTITGAMEEFLPTTRECRLLEMKAVGDECFARYALLP